MLPLIRGMSGYSAQNSHSFPERAPTRRVTSAYPPGYVARPVADHRPGGGCYGLVQVMVAGTELLPLPLPMKPNAVVPLAGTLPL